MIYRITHTTEYLYSDRVSHCYNMGHMIPRSTLRQKCLQHHVRLDPIAAYTSEYTDYFGNHVFHFEIQRPHTTLRISSSSRVDTSPQHAALNLDFGTTCAEARNQLQHTGKPDNLLAREFLLESPMVPFSQTLRDYAKPFFDDDRPLLSAVMALTSAIHRDFTYCPESTTVATPLSEVIKNRRGVCQDFAHLQIACLRALGFPAKYVSGYLETMPPPGEEKLVGVDASHAWVSVFSPNEGWFEFDPTNDCITSEQHIITAWGRDYLDVTPLRGVIFGGGETPILNVSVDVARL